MPYIQNPYTNCPDYYEEATPGPVGPPGPEGPPGPSGGVDSVNGLTGVVVIDTDDISDAGATNKYVTAADLVVLSNTSGTNTGDQTSIVGITGTLAEFNTALTGADFATGGGTVTGASSGTNTGDQTSIVGITGTLAEFNTALTGADFATGGGTVTGASSGTNTGDDSVNSLYSGLVSSKIIPLADFYTDAASSGVAVTDAYSFNIPANTLANNGDKIFFNYVGISTATSSNVRVLVNFAGVDISAATSSVFNTSWFRQGYFIRVNSTTMRVFQLYKLGGSGFTFDAYEEVAGLNFTVANTLKITLQALVSGITTAKLGTVYYQAAA